MSQNKRTVNDVEDKIAIVSASTSGTGITQSTKEAAEKAKKSLDGRLLASAENLQKLSASTQKGAKAIVKAIMDGQNPSDFGGVKLLSKVANKLGDTLGQMHEIMNNIKQDIKAKASPKPTAGPAASPEQKPSAAPRRGR